MTCDILDLVRAAHDPARVAARIAATQCGERGQLLAEMTMLAATTLDCFAAALRIDTADILDHLDTATHGSNVVRFPR